MQDINVLLVERCRQGDRKAQHELYARYARAMLNVAMRLVNDYGVAEDLLQESFVDAFTKIHQFKGESSFGLWLKRIVINNALNFLRKYQRQPLVVTDQFDEEQPHEEPDEPVYPYDVDQVHRTIQGLPDGYRLVFTLYCLEGYDHGEIGQILNISEQTSKSQYNRARKKIRELLNG
ncbi:RNA polymerase sigma-70 factor, ECF subfamily [Catalinimonas alkaloidigena]|uniref:RNA polymerase sigma-70 factor, ECF subfamily n=1 Tax=Catalinimonas alkaloidigena TaxID=1075417 RepID=A0A1G8WQ22_9BACT|nr:RNA polymerase sigma-70 factor, ECF subfamily [Catalinimonas alkaloidigena]